LVSREGGSFSFAARFTYFYSLSRAFVACILSMYSESGAVVFHSHHPPLPLHLSVISLPSSTVCLYTSERHECPFVPDFRQAFRRAATSGTNFPACIFHALSNHGLPLQLLLHINSHETCEILCSVVLIFISLVGTIRSIENQVGVDSFRMRSFRIWSRTYLLSCPRTVIGRPYCYRVVYRPHVRVCCV